MLTDSRFWVGVAVGVVAAMFVVPFVRAQLAVRAAAGA